MISREKGEGKAEEASEEIIFKIDVPANRFQFAIFVIHLTFILFFLPSILKTLFGALVTMFSDF